MAFHHVLARAVALVGAGAILWRRRAGGSPPGPAGLLQAYRFLVDSRDLDTERRLDNLEDPYRLFRCRAILNCTDVCPKGLNPACAISKSKSMLARRAV